MENFLKTIKTISVLLILILISVISFVGIYVQKEGVWTDILPEYKTGMEFNGYRQLHYVLDDTEEIKEVYVDKNGNYKGDVLNSLNSVSETETETEQITEVATEAELDVVKGYSKEQRTEKVNPDDKINIETFEKTKKIIQERIENQGGYEYNIRQDSITGELVVEVPDDGKAEIISALVTSVGEVTIIDSETGIILIDNSYIKSAGVLTSELPPEDVEVQGETEEHDHEEIYYQAYLQLEFNEKGTELIKEISSEYLASNDESEIKMISVMFDNQNLISTYFGEPLETGSIQIPLGDPVASTEELYELATKIARIAEVVNTEELPLVYNLKSDNYIKSSITEDLEMKISIIFALAVLIISIIMIVKYKLNGLKQAIISIGFIGSLLLIIRLVSVILTYNSIVAFIGIILINYLFSFKILKKLKDEKNRKIALKETMKELYLAIIPVCIVAFIFTFMTSVTISSIGNVLFWGLLVQAIFSLFVLI